MTNCFKILLLVVFISASTGAVDYKSGQSILTSDGGVIRGSITNDLGAAIDDALVLFYTDEFILVDSTFSDINGLFLKHLESGRYYISASAYNYCRKLYPNTYQPSSAGLIEISSSQIKEIEFKLERGGLISGTIAVDSYQPAEFFLTAIKVDSPNEGWNCTRNFTIDFYGDYCLDGLIPGYYKVFARGANFESEYYPGVGIIDDAETIEVQAGTIAGAIDFDLNRPGSGTLEGSIFNTDGQPIVGATITAYQWENAEYDPNKVTVFSDFNGLFELEVTGGYYYISALIDQGENSTDDITIYYDNCFSPEMASEVLAIPDQSLGDIDFEIDLSQSFNLQILGTVINEDTGLPIEGAKLTALDYFTGLAVSSAFSQYNGDFIIDNLMSGTYLVEITGNGLIPSFWLDVFCWQQAQTIVLNNDNSFLQNGGAITQDYGTPGFEIMGRVYGQGEPLSGVRVYAMNLGSGKVAYARTNPNGFYTITSGLQEGDYSLFADKYGWQASYYPHIISLDLIENPQVDDINFEMMPVVVDIKPGEALPRDTELLGNYPNPFNNSTAIIIRSVEFNNTELEIYNLSGQLVNSLPISAHPGVNIIRWDGQEYNGNNVSSGIYFYRLKDLPETRKMVLLK